MLRNSFLNRYKVRIHNGIEYEDNFTNRDDNDNIYTNRPIGEKEIKKLPDSKLSSFVEDLMTNRKSTSILYSTNANKEILRYLHSNEVLGKNSTTQRGGSSLSTNSNAEEISDSKKIREYRFNSSNIKEHIKNFKANRMAKFNALTKKNLIFYDEIKQQINSRDYSSQVVNSLRLTNYNRSLQRCKSIFENKPNFKLPNVGLEIDNVFSRLYNNVVQSNQTKGEIEAKKRSLHSSQSFTGKNNNNNNEKLFNLKKVIESSNGKEFTIKITNKIFNKCFSKHSGGPLYRLDLFYNKKCRYNSNANAVNSDDNEHYNCNDINKLAYQEKPLLSLSNTKDRNGNSYLHDAVLENSYAFVKFYLGKKLSPNEQNASGNTPLHFAMKINNNKIIKLLLEHKADITIKNIYNETPYDLASNESKKSLRLRLR